LSLPHPPLLRLAQGLITAGVLLGVLAFAARATGTRDVALLALEGGALLFAAAAYLAHLASHRPSLRDLVLRSGLVTAFVLWAAVQLAPSFRGAALLNDGAIVLFIADLAFVLMPWRLTEQ
jgi:hypothetical protein